MIKTQCTYLQLFLQGYGPLLHTDPLIFFRFPLFAFDPVFVHVLLSSGGHPLGFLLVGRDYVVVLRTHLVTSQHATWPVHFHFKHWVCSRASREFVLLLTSYVHMYNTPVFLYLCKSMTWKMAWMGGLLVMVSGSDILRVTNFTTSALITVKKNIVRKWFQDMWRLPTRTRPARWHSSLPLEEKGLSPKSRKFKGCLWYTSIYIHLFYCIDRTATSNKVSS